MHGQFITTTKTLTPAFCASVHGFVVFGDNAQRTGKKGQSEIRDCPNAIGVATKWKPSREPDAYFSDSAPAMKIVAKDLAAVKALLDAGYNVYWPAASIGTGLAELPTRSPDIHAMIERFVAECKKRYV